MYDSYSELRLVTFYAFLLILFQGITLKLIDDGRCLVARIMHGGMIHRQGICSDNEPRCEKTGLWGFRPGTTQSGLYSHRRWLDA